MAQDFQFFPKARLALDNGDLVDVNSVTVSATNNAKLIHTLRKSPAGYTDGTQEVSLSFEGVISDSGQETDYKALVQRSISKQFRFKLPGGDTFVLNSRITKVDWKVDTENATTFSVEAICQMDE